MSKTILETAGAPKAIGPYSQGVRASGTELIFLSGQIGLDPKTQEIVQGGVESEARRALENLRAVLESAGLTLDDVVRTTVYLVDLADFARVNAIYASFFTKQPPARSTIGVAALPKNGRVEIDAIAVTGRA